MATDLNPLVSINIATYNRANFIKQALDGILAQTFRGWEAIIVDDGSTDQTAEIVQPYLSDPRFRYLRNETNKNISYTRNRALDESRGKYVAILDSDDIWTDPEKLNKQLAFLEENPGHLLVGTQVNIINDKGLFIKKLTVATTDNQIRQKLLRTNQFVHSTVLYRREAVLHVGKYNLDLNGIEDYDLWLRLGQGGKFANLPDTCAAYRVHPLGITTTARLRLMRHNLELVQKNRGNYPGYRSALVRRSVRLCLYKILCLFLRK